MRRTLIADGSELTVVVVVLWLAGFFVWTVTWNWTWFSLFTFFSCMLIAHFGVASLAVAILVLLIGVFLTIMPVKWRKGLKSFRKGLAESLFDTASGIN